MIMTSVKLCANIDWCNVVIVIWWSQELVKLRLGCLVYFNHALKFQLLDQACYNNECAGVEISVWLQQKPAKFAV